MIPGRRVRWSIENVPSPAHCAHLENVAAAKRANVGVRAVEQVAVEDQYTAPATLQKCNVNTFTVSSTPPLLTCRILHTVGRRNPKVHGTLLHDILALILSALEFPTPSPSLSSK